MHNETDFHAALFCPETAPTEPPVDLSIITGVVSPRCRSKARRVWMVGLSYPILLW